MKKNKIRDSKIAKRAIKRLIKKNQKVFDSLAKGDERSGKEKER
jgi:hypothetical protein